MSNIIVELQVYFQMKLQNSVGESVPKTKNMTADSQKKSHHHHHHHHQHPHKKMVQIKTLERITNLPVVESAHAYYEKIKNSNTLIKWSLMPAETGVWLAVGTAMPVVSYFEKPVSAVDSIFCMGLDVLEANLPMIKYPPDLVYNITKDYVTSKVVTPVMKRADSVKQLSINGANNFGELAANRLNNAIDVADKYVDKYLPDISDAPDSTTDGPNPASNPHPNSKRSKTIQHVNQFSRKLQRRLTRRTIAEARALKQQGADTLRSFVYLVNLLASDPKQFMEKARAMWLELSKDEPENQVPPANLEQLIEMLMREFARRVVHLTNYSYAKMIVLTHHGMEAAHIAACAAIYWANQVIKAMHLEPAIEKTVTQVVRAHTASIEFVEKLVELISNLKMEGLKVAEKRAILPSEQPPQPSQSTDSVSPQRTSSISSVSSVTSYVSTASSNTITPSKPPHPSLNGETYTVYESKHEQIVS